MDLFSYSPLAASYASINDALNRMRELFHQTGRFDDSNAKLDEVVKLFATYLAYRRGLIKNFPHYRRGGFIPTLQESFQEALQLECYRDQNGRSIFGANPILALQDGDEDLALALVTLARRAIDAALTNKELDNPFDVLNESFGHFVRDNFRSNIEDAQYMTPPEVVEFMVELALEEINRQVQAANSHSFIVLDPSCGVGSFLAAFYHKAKALEFFQHHPLCLVGQDKVERMVRLTMLNLALFESTQHSVTIGNSLAGNSPLRALNGQVDLILTNPPFGAKFDSADVLAYGSETLPIFAPIANGLQKIDSELLFVDRNLKLLKDGGQLLIVVPDSVVSANGLPALLRQKIKHYATIQSVIELPAVTFAQAGTRTKTCILHLVKRAHTDASNKVFLAVAKELGFEVSSRKGVQVKVAKGDNDLSSILTAYRRAPQFPDGDTQVILEEPSCVYVKYQEFINNSWTPNHYNAARLKSVAHLEDSSEIESIPLQQLVEFQSERRKGEPYTEECLFISVLHIIGEGILDIKGIYSYRPKTPGIHVKPNEVILSKINPRIPRVLVVPDFGRRILCSSEFEVMTPKKGIEPYLLSYLLLSDSVQQQITSLTSGTSASHNRIKSSDLAKVMMPLPRAGTTLEANTMRLVGEYEKVIKSLVQDTIKLSALRTGSDEKQSVFFNHSSSQRGT